MGVGVGVGEGVSVPVALGVRDCEGVIVGVDEEIPEGDAPNLNPKGKGVAIATSGVEDTTTVEEAGGISGAGGGGEAPNECEEVGVILCEGVGLGV